MGQNPGRGRYRLHFNSATGAELHDHAFLRD